MKKDLKNFIEEHIHGTPKRMNVEFHTLANVNGFKLSLHTNAGDHEEPMQGIGLDDEFLKVLSLFGATLEPTLPEIINFFKGKTEPSELTIKIQTDNVAYETIAFDAIINRILDIWIDTNELKEVEKIKYEVIYWDSEEAREIPESTYYDEFEDLETAIKECIKLSENFPCAEVVRPFGDGESETIYFAGIHSETGEYVSCYENEL